MKTRLFILAAALLLMAIAAHSQEKSKFTKIDWALLAADASARTLDTISTRMDLSAPCKCNREAVLPGFIANHTGTMVVYSAGMVGADYLAVRMLVKHHHPRMAKALQIADFIEVTPMAVHNLTLRRTSAPNQWRTR